MEPRGTITHGRSPTWTVRAARVSRGLPMPHPDATPDGVVVSVHRTAINLRLNGRLVAIAGTSVGALPNGVTVARGWDAGSFGIRPGDAAVLADGALEITSRAGRVWIDLSSATSWSPVLSAVVVRAPGLRARARLVRAATEARSHGLARNGRFAPRAEPFIRALRAALVAGDVGAAADAGEELIGLGPGLTPSGDDLLVGVTAALAAVGDPAGRALTRGWADAAAGTTTAVAAAFHWHAARGEYAERLHILLAALLAGPLNGISPAVDRASQWGATSGDDLLAGVALGLAVAADGPRQGSRWT